jgi:hypothetical protein
MEAELRRVCGADIYDELAAYCQSRHGARKRANERSCRWS